MVEAVDKKKARLNCIRHLLTQVPYKEIQRQPIKLPPRVHNAEYQRRPVPSELYIPEEY